MHVSMTVPTDDLATSATIYRELEEVGYDRAFSFEAKHDPFVPLAVAVAAHRAASSSAPPSPSRSPARR